MDFTAQKRYQSLEKMKKMMNSSLIKILVVVCQILIKGEISLHREGDSPVTVSLTRNSEIWKKNSQGKPYIGKKLTKVVEKFSGSPFKLP